MKALVYTTQAKMDGRKVIEPGKCELLDIPEPQLLPTDDMKTVSYTHLTLPTIA
mgnify:CR=1 FL=1